MKDIEYIFYGLRINRAQLIEGMSVALYTTLVGSILSVWLGLIYQMLATGTSNLVSRIIELSES